MYCIYISIYVSIPERYILGGATVDFGGLSPQAPQIALMLILRNSIGRSSGIIKT